LLITALAALTRLWALGFPPGKSFDEVYYATEAQELLRYGYEDNRNYTFIVHPPLGKWCIALTSWLFGDNAWGWRLAPAIAGTVSVLIITRLAQRMFHSTILGVLAGALLTMDGISLVMSRTALLDIFLQTFVLAGFAALVVDRDQVRSRLGELYASGVDLTTGVPSLGPRPWRLLGGVLLGLACAVKWSGLSFWLGFALLSLLWDRSALKAVGVKRTWRTTVKRSFPGGFFSLGVAAIAAYLLSWIGWFVGENSWSRHWGDTHPGNGLFALLPSSLRGLIDYHHEAYAFHSHLYSSHPYKANPWSWLVLGRPISFYYPSDVQGCGASSCVREILLIGTPIMYWAIIPALLWLGWHWLTTRDWRAGAIGMAFLAGFGVWLQNTKRTGFLFYMTPLMPFLVLALTFAVGAMLARAAEDGLPLSPETELAPETELDGLPADNAGAEMDEVPGVEESTEQGQAATAGKPDDSDAEIDLDVADIEDGGVREVGLIEWIRLRGVPTTRLLRTVAVSLWLGAVVADFIFMWPIFTGGLLTRDQWELRMWFPSWI
jgi:dolichyl-phosphate-mannose--protein O-mannosyl transferase